jgi:hypothetical protein
MQASRCKGADADERNPNDPNERMQGSGCKRADPSERMLTSVYAPAAIYACLRQCASGTVRLRRTAPAGQGQGLRPLCGFAASGSEAAASAPAPAPTEDLPLVKNCTIRLAPAHSEHCTEFRTLYGKMGKVENRRTNYVKIAILAICDLCYLADCVILIM